MGIERVGRARPKTSALVSRLTPYNSYKTPKKKSYNPAQNQTLALNPIFSHIPYQVVARLDEKTAELVCKPLVPNEMRAVALRLGTDLRSFGFFLARLSDIWNVSWFWGKDLRGTENMGDWAGGLF